MSTFLKSYEQFEDEKNVAIDTFVKAAMKQKAAFEAGEMTNRSWVKEDIRGFVAKLGKTDKSYVLSDKAAVTKFFDDAILAAQTEDDFKSMIEAAYSTPADAEPVKPKRAYKRRQQTLA
ncbi:hypothetical protein [Endobacterium cereale]|uniref:hypothetical protein n=1 Tax=Endobacterium cereale TaxID=2663029 RepID=UPI002B472A88|nr:hypothetical protein [Endobacterium cereale]MEB2843797.1 hypothetical protein [Endobacterium cereale]